MSNIKKVATLASLLLLLSSGCFFSSTMATAKVLEPGETQIAVGGMSILNADGFLPIFNYRIGTVEKFDIGVGMDAFATFKLDGRLSLLQGEKHGIDMCLELGSARLLFIVPSYYAGLGISKQFGSVTPYAHYRYSGVSGTTESDLDADVGDGDYNFSLNWDQLTYGVQINFNERMGIIAEYSTILGIEDSTTNENVTHYSLGLVLMH